VPSTSRDTQALHTKPRSGPSIGAMEGSGNRCSSTSPPNLQANTTSASHHRTFTMMPIFQASSTEEEAGGEHDLAPLPAGDGAGGDRFRHRRAFR
jgi:hypothetical protein